MYYIIFHVSAFIDGLQSGPKHVARIKLMKTSVVCD